MRASILILLLAGCTPTWPEEHFPSHTEVAEVLFAEGTSGLREACEAMVVELTDRSAARLMSTTRSRNDKLAPSPPKGWLSTPAFEVARSPNFFRSAFGGCNDDGKRPLGDLEGALERPGAIYKIINHGEGIAIIAPRAKLAGYFYFG